MGDGPSTSQVPPPALTPQQHAALALQGLLNQPNPDFDPNSPASQQRRAQFQENPVNDILQYIAAKKAQGR